jgi:hypothetical protein
VTENFRFEDESWQFLAHAASLAGSNEVPSSNNCRFWPFAEILVAANRLKHPVQRAIDGTMPFLIA